MRIDLESPCVYRYWNYHWQCHDLLILAAKKTSISAIRPYERTTHAITWSEVFSTKRAGSPCSSHQSKLRRRWKSTVRTVEITRFGFLPLSELGSSTMIRIAGSDWEQANSSMDDKNWKPWPAWNLRSKTTELGHSSFFVKISSSTYSELLQTPGVKPLDTTDCAQARQSSFQACMCNNEQVAWISGRERAKQERSIKRYQIVSDLLAWGFQARTIFRLKLAESDWDQVSSLHDVSEWDQVRASPTT